MKPCRHHSMARLSVATVLTLGLLAPFAGTCSLTGCHMVNCVSGSPNQAYTNGDISCKLCTSTVYCIRIGGGCFATDPAVTIYKGAAVVTAFKCPGNPGSPQECGCSRNGTAVPETKYQCGVFSKPKRTNIFLASNKWWKEWH
jgi:hypothetical protein